MTKKDEQEQALAANYAAVSDSLFEIQCYVAAMPIAAKRLSASADPETIARKAFDMAEAMVAERERRRSKKA